MEVRVLFARFIWRGVNIDDVTLHPSRCSGINPTLQVCEHNWVAHASPCTKFTIFASNFCTGKLCRLITLQPSVAIPKCRKTCFPQIVVLQYKTKPDLGFQNLGCHCKILGCHFDTQKRLKKHCNVCLKVSCIFLVFGVFGAFWLFLRVGLAFFHHDTPPGNPDQKRARDADSLIVHGTGGTPGETASYDFRPAQLSTSKQSSNNIN